MTHRRYPRTGRRLAIAGTLALALFVGACASSAPPEARIQKQFTQTTSALDEAEEVGAQELAPLALRDAKEKMRKANDAMANDKKEKALRLAEEAQVDAELAEVTALSEKAKQAVAELRESIKTLKQEIARANDGS